MKEKKFKIYLIFCIIAFAILLFVVLFYSFGYKYNPIKGRLIQTGAIIAKTTPKNADIYINGKIVKKDVSLTSLFNDFVKIEGLVPGEYSIKISMPKYFTWEKNIAVRSEYVTDLKNVVLLMKNFEKNVLAGNIEANNSKNMWVNNGKNKVVYRKIQNNKNQLFLFDLQNNQEKLLYSLENIFPTKTKTEYSIKDIIWSDDDRKLILDITIFGKDAFAIIDLDNNKVYYTKDTLGDIKNKWNIYFSNSLLYLKDNTLYSFVYADSTSLKMLSDISGFLVEDNYIYYFKTNDQNLYRNDRNSLNSEMSLFEMPDGFNPKLASKIVRSSQNTFLILSSAGKLYFINGQGISKNINSEAKYAFFASNSTRILYGNNNEIWIYYIKEKLSQPQKSAFTNELLTRFSGNISNVYLFRDEEHVFYKEGDVFKFIELDGRDRRNVFDITDIKNNDILYREEDSSIIFIENNRLMKASLEESK